MKLAWPLVAVLVSSGTIACSAESRDATGPGELAAAKSPKPPAEDTRSRVQLIWHDQMDGTPTGFRADGRDRYGSAVPAGGNAEYQGNFCGVRGFLYDGRAENGNLEFDSDSHYTSDMDGACGGPRTMRVYAGDASALGTVPIDASPHITAAGIWNLPVGATAATEVAFGMQGLGPACKLVVGGAYEGSASAVAQRLADGEATGADGTTVAVRRWLMASLPPHTAACLEQQRNGRWIDSGRRYFLPFAVSVTQVPYPYPVFP